MKILTLDTITETDIHMTSTLNGQWPTDTWFRRALARKLKADAQALEQEASNANNMPSVQS